MMKKFENFLNESNSDDNFQVGDEVVCINNSDTSFNDFQVGDEVISVDSVGTLTKNKVYTIIHADENYIDVIDDYDEISGWLKHRFIKKELSDEEKRKRDELKLIMKIKHREDDPFGEEDWLSESNSHNFKVGDEVVCVNDLGAISFVKGEKYIISNCSGSYVGIKGYGTGWRADRFEKIFTKEEIRKREELKLKHINDDPYEEEDWLSERRVSYKKTLCPDIWEDDKLKERIRVKLMRIANDFYSDMDLDVELLDVYLTGSIANYNYNAESDIDIHLIVDYSEVNDDIELVEKAFDGERYVWNLRHNIVIHGHDIEIYVQNIKAKHASSGIYSIMNDEWVKKPVYNRPTVDQVDVDNKYDIRVKDIKRYEKLSKEDLTPEEAEEYYISARKLKKKIQKARTEGLNIIGEFSIENLVFKKLRKTGKFGKLIDSISRLYDKIYSQ